MTQPTVLDALSVMGLLQEWGLVDSYKRLILPYHDAQAALRLYKPDIAVRGLDYHELQAALAVAHRQPIQMPKAEPGLPMLKALGVFPPEVDGIRQVDHSYYALISGQEAVLLGTGKELQSYVPVAAAILEGMGYLVPVELRRKWADRVWPHLAKGVSEVLSTPTRLEQTWTFLHLYASHRGQIQIDLNLPDGLATWHPSIGNRPICVFDGKWAFSFPDFLEWCGAFWKHSNGNVNSLLREAGGTTKQLNYRLEGQRYFVTCWKVPVEGENGS